MSKSNKIYKIFMISMIVAMAGMLIAMGVLAVSKSMKLTSSISMIPNAKIEMHIHNQGEEPTSENLVFRNFASGDKTVYVNESLSSLSANTLMLTSTFLQNLENEFVITIFNYDTNNGLKVDATSNADLTSSTDISGVPAEIFPSQSGIIKCSDVSNAPFERFNIKSNAILNQTTYIYFTFTQSEVAEVSTTISNATISTNKIVGSEPYVATIKAESGYKLPNNITVSGASNYTWQVSQDGMTGTLTIPQENITGEIVVSATTSVATYTITYNLDGGSVATSNPTTYTKDTATITLNNPTKTGYTFNGWRGSNGYTPSTNVTIPTGSTGDKTYNAVWTINTYTFKINPNGGTYNGSTSVSSSSLVYGTTTTMSANPTRTGYTFTGWEQSNTDSGASFNGGVFSYGSGTSDYSDYVMRTAGSYVPNGLGTEYTTGLGATSGPYDKNTGSTDSTTTVTTTNPVLGASGTIYRTTTTTSVKSGSLYHAGMNYLSKELMKNHTYYYVIVAKIPTGWNINATGNTTTAVSSGWVTPTAGTGDWATYIYKYVRANAGHNMDFGHLFATSSTAPSGNVVIDIAMAKWYDYSLSRSSVSSTMYNKFTIGAANTTLTATWRANSNAVTVTPSSTAGKFSFSSSNIFNSQSSDIIKGGELYNYNNNPGSWAGAVSTKTNNNKFVSGYIRIISGATYKITGSTSGGKIGWITRDSMAKGSQLTNYSNNTNFTVPTSYTDTSTSASTSITYTYLRFDSNLSDLSNIKLILVSTPQYTSTQTLYLNTGSDLTVSYTANSGYFGEVVKSSGSGTLKNAKLSSITGNSGLAMNWVTGYLSAGETTYNGSNYTNLGRTYMYTSKITINVLAYMDNWANFNSSGMRLLSCTESGGWNFETNNGNVAFACYDSGVGYKSAVSTVAFASLSSGWHMFTGVFDGTSAKLYIDGVLKATGSTFSSKAIGYNSSNVIFVGAEAGSNSSPAGSYFIGKMKQISIRNVSLTASQISALYNVIK